MQIVRQWQGRRTITHVMRHVMTINRWLSLPSGLVVTLHDVMSVHIIMLMNMQQVNHTLSQPPAIRRALQDLMLLGTESNVYLLATKRSRGVSDGNS